MFSDCLGLDRVPTCKERASEMGMSHPPESQGLSEMRSSVGGVVSKDAVQATMKHVCLLLLECVSPGLIN